MLILTFLFSAIIHAASLNERVQVLNFQSKDSSKVLTLNTDSFSVLLQKPRNYSVILTLTALGDQYKCQTCLELNKELPLLASSWAKQRIPGKLYVASLDFEQGQEIFRKLGLRSVPVIQYYPPTAGPDAAPSGSEEFQTLSNVEGQLNADALAHFISAESSIKIKISRPINFQFYGMVILTGIIAISIIAFAATKLSFLFQFKKLWSISTIVFMTIMCSGFMWNTIRTPPFMGGNFEKGLFSLFAGGSQYQFGVETNVVAGIYLLCSLFFSLLVTIVPYIPNPQIQRYAAYICLSAFLVVFSLLLRIFRVKNGGYPFKLLF